MRKKLYLLIKEALLSLTENNTTLIKDVNYWNEQIMYAMEEQPFSTPSVFLEFNTINWTHQLQGVKEADIEIRLHVITPSRVGDWQEAINNLDIADKINQSLTGLCTDNISALQLLRSETDHNFDELQDNVEIYSTHVTDFVAYSKHNNVKVIPMKNNE
jgi:hypothetical protein